MSFTISIVYFIGFSWFKCRSSLWEIYTQHTQTHTQRYIHEYVYVHNIYMCLYTYITQCIFIIYGDYILWSHWEHQISKYWIITLKGCIVLCSCEPLVTFLSTSQYINLFYVCFCLKTTHLIYIVESWTLNSWPAVLTHA